LAEWIGQRETPDEKAPADRKPRGARLAGLKQRTAAWFSWLQSPLAVAWTAAVIITVTIIVWMLRDYAESLRSRGPRGNPVADDGDEQRGEPPDLRTIEQQLEELAARIEAFQAEHGRFPEGRMASGGNDLESRFGWLAELEAAYPSTSRPGPTPRWDRGWQDPVNDGFVRRRLPAVINPSSPEQVGDDGFPTTHFVGVAGVGADGPTLPADHPRAGIFGYDRVTRPEDVADGLSNTIMIAGVQSQLGSWADGNSSIRPFVEAPYINGPDGFGTGQSDGMFVLMADGSVKFLSSDIDPVVMRRMTAMSDGFSLDPRLPGDPIDLEPATAIAADDPALDVEPEPVEVDVPEGPMINPQVAGIMEEPIDVPVAVAPVRAFIERSLAVSLIRFEQREPVELRLMLRTLEELIGSRFAWNVPDTAEWSDVLDRRVTISLENTTIEAVLSGVLASVGLTYRLEDEGIYIEPQ
jgi:hypothetical protein